MSIDNEFDENLKQYFYNYEKKYSNVLKVTFGYADKEKYKDIAKCDEDVLSLALFENVATEFLKNKYATEKDEVDEFNLFV